MKRIILAAFMVLLAICVSAQTSQTEKKVTIIDGYFFYENPVSRQKIVKMHILRTPNGASALGLELSEPLPERALKYAVPKEQIPEGEMLLQRYNEVKKSQSGISVTNNIRQSILKEGDKFPDFSETDIDGRKWTNADVKGKVMVLNLWYTGCGPCRTEMPELSTWKDEMPDVMFFSSTYEDAERARPVLEAQKFNWIPLVNDSQFTKFIGNNGYPMTIVVDKEGIIAKVEFGTSAIQREDLKETIRSLR